MLLVVVGRLSKDSERHSSLLFICLVTDVYRSWMLSRLPSSFVDRFATALTIVCVHTLS